MPRPAAGLFAPASPAAGSFAPASSAAGSFTPASPAAVPFTPASPAAVPFTPASPAAGSFTPASPAAGSFTPAPFGCDGFPLNSRLAIQRNATKRASEPIKNRGYAPGRHAGIGAPGIALGIEPMQIVNETRQQRAAAVVLVVFHRTNPAYPEAPPLSAPHKMQQIRRPPVSPPRFGGSIRCATVLRKTMEPSSFRFRIQPASDFLHRRFPGVPR